MYFQILSYYIVMNNHRGMMSVSMYPETKEIKLGCIFQFTYFFVCFYFQGKRLKIEYIFLIEAQTFDYTLILHV